MTESSDKDSVGQLWEEVGSLYKSRVNYDISNQPDKHVIGYGIDFLERYLGSGGLVVDFCCWGGRHIPLLVEISKLISVLGIDGHWAFHRLAKVYQEFLNKEQVDIKVFRDLHNLKFLTTGSVQGGICWRVLHNLVLFGQIDETLREFHRVLCPGAPLLVALRAPKESQLKDFPYHQYLLSKVPGGFYRADLYYSEEAAIRLFIMHGFKVVDTYKINEKEVYFVDGKDVSVTNSYHALHLLRVPA